MNSFKNIYKSLVFKDIVVPLTFAQSVSASATVIALYYLYQKKNEYLEFKEYIQNKNKDIFLQKQQTYFIENFNAPFTFKANYDEGFGLLYPYISRTDKAGLLAYRSLFDYMNRDFQSVMPFHLINAFMFPIVGLVVLGTHLYSINKTWNLFNSGINNKKKTGTTNQNTNSLGKDNGEKDCTFDIDTRWIRFTDYSKQTMRIVGFISLLKFCIKY